MSKKINSRRKGKDGELEFVGVLRAKGFAARRGQQFSGSPDSPDVVTNIGKVHLEVKRTETLSLYKAYGQAVRGSTQDRIPVVVHRRSKEAWLAILSAADLLEIIRRNPEFFDVKEVEDD